MNGTDDLAIRIKGGGTICVPGALKFLTPYVLLEQEDWFEKELAFVRRWLRPGMRAIDIGANYGIYTVTMAQAVGAGGAVLAFEPASATAGYLHKSIARGGFGHVTVKQMALSDRQSTARLRLQNNPELKALSDESSGPSEEVRLSTLDHECAAADFGRVDFVKLDAEGEEVRIVTGGERLFREQSPLVMFELKHGATVNAELLTAFRDRGYDLYRLIGPDWLLVPFATGEVADNFELNLLACKPDRAALLEQAGLLARGEPPAAAPPGAGLDLWRRQPFSAAFESAEAVDPRYAEALDWYAMWRDAESPLGQRTAALHAALARLKELAQGSDRLSLLSMLARVANEAGSRQIAVDVLSRVAQRFGGSLPPAAGPFWPADARYDDLPPGARPMDWFSGAVIEALERGRAFSSYFARPATLPLLDWLRQTPFASPEMERRRQLMRMRAGQQKGRVAAPILAAETPDNLNPGFWRSR